MNDLQAMAIRAVNEAIPSHPGGMKIQAVKILRDMDGRRRRYLGDYIKSVEWAMSRPRTTLTRADKERAVKKLASRLADACEDAAYKDCGQPAGDTKDIAYYRRRQYLLRKALVRLAMARTVD